MNDNLESMNTGEMDIKTASAEALKQRICARAVEIGALLTGEFVLTSGKTSNIYFDGRVLLLDPVGAALVAELFWREVKKQQIDAFGGPAVGSVLIVGALAHRAAQESSNIKGFFVRNTAKAHGTQKSIEGNLQPKSRVLVVEDTVTTGGSLLRATDALEAAQCEVVRVVAVLDRNEGAKDKFTARDIPFDAFLSIDALVAFQS